MSNETNVSSKGPSYFWHFFLSFFKTLYNWEILKITTSTCVVSWNLLVNVLEQFLAEEWTWSIHIFWFTNLSKCWILFAWLPTTVWYSLMNFILRWRPVVWMEYGAFESAVYIVWISKIIIGIVYVRGGGWNYKVAFAYHKKMQCTALRGPLHTCLWPMVRICLCLVT